MSTTSDDQPFSGIRVAEFGQFVAVPFCGQLLAEGGAEVIKIESPEGDPTRRMGQLSPGETRVFISRNRGKHTLPLKLRDATSKPVVNAILDWADVVLMNFRPGLSSDLDLVPSDLLRRYPRLIVGEITPFGKKGPDAGLSAMDIVVQARSGLMAANGRIIDNRPAPGDPVSSDYMAAMMLAFGVSSALLRRERTGRGGLVDVTLMQAAMTLANNQFIRSEDRDREDHLAQIKRLAEQRASGASFIEQTETITPTRAFPLLAIYFRTYATHDGTIAIACASRSLQSRFTRAIGFSDEGLDAGDTWAEKWNDYYTRLKAEVEPLIQSKSSAEWTSILNTAGVPVSTVKFPVELFEDVQAEANGMFQLIQHPKAGLIRALAPPVGLDGDGFRPATPTPTFGSETRALLKELGLDDGEVDKLIATGITNEGLSG